MTDHQVDTLAWALLFIGFSISCTATVDDTFIAGCLLLAWTSAYVVTLVMVFT